jgi:FdhE protein
LSESIKDRLDTVTKLILERQDLKKPLDLIKDTLQIQKEMVESSTVPKFVESFSLTEIEKFSLKSKKPIIHFLQFKIFYDEALFIAFKKITKIFLSKFPKDKGLIILFEKFEEKKSNNDFYKLVESVFREDERYISNYAEKFSIEPSTLFFMVNVTIQPFIEMISQRLSVSFFNQWWQANCPVCGRKPVTARVRDRKRYLSCIFCGAEFLSDRFLCVNCGNKDPYTLKYMMFEKKPGYQIDFCTRCNHYIKIIQENRTEPIPRFLEDLFTLDLDIQAKNTGLIR